MTTQIIYTGQNIAKDCIVGDRQMNRYAIFNGLEYPRRIDSNMNVTRLGVNAASNPTAAVDAGAGTIAANWYAWKAVYASRIHTRPVPVADGSGNYTRGNPSAGSVALDVGAGRSVDVTVPCIDQEGITHVLLYRSVGAGSQVIAETGPFFYVAQGLNQGATVTITDNVVDGLLGIIAEEDNYPPNAYRYAVNTDGYILAGGGFPIGLGLTCTVTPGSSLVTLDSGEAFYDGIIGWRFKCLEDGSGGFNERGLYFANYVDSHTIQLVDESNDPLNYDGALSGSGQTFSVYVPDFVFRWCKKGEPEAWPLTNLINFGGSITGLAQLPNQSLILVCTDEPSMRVLDLNLIGTDSFKTNKSLLSTEHTASSHYSIVPVEGRLRAIDAYKSCIIETDGTSVVDISSSFIPKIFKYLSQDSNDIKLWHCAYDQRQHLFGAFVTFDGAQRLIDFCLGQYTTTKGWFFNLEKDLLCTGDYTHPETSETMVLGGTEGPGNGLGGVWGRIWCPNVYSEWLPDDSLRSGTITGTPTSQTFEVDVSGGAFRTETGGLIGRWALVCDSNGEYAQLGYIISNTSSSITVDRVINGLDPVQFSPVPEAGWRFYLGLIECRWGPKKFDFGDPDVLKKIWEVWCCVSGHNEDDPPFIRLYRGYEQGYASQLTLQERVYLDKTMTQSLVNKVDNKLESMPRWGVAWYDRSYEPTTLHSLTIVFNPLQDMGKK